MNRAPRRATRTATSVPRVRGDEPLIGDALTAVLDGERPALVGAPAPFKHRYLGLGPVDGDAAVDGDTKARDVAAQVHAEGGDLARLARRPPAAAVAAAAAGDLGVGQ